MWRVAAWLRLSRKKVLVFKNNPWKQLTRAAPEVAGSFARTWNWALGFAGQILLTRELPWLGEMGFCSQSQWLGCSSGTGFFPFVAGKPLNHCDFCTVLCWLRYQKLLSSQQSLSCLCDWSAVCIQRKDYTALTKFLPPKYEYVLEVRMTPIQCKLYQYYLDHLTGTCLQFSQVTRSVT